MRHLPWTTIVRVTVVAAVVFAVGGVAVVGAMLAANSVDTDVTHSDRAVIASLDVDDVCAATEGFQDELVCIQQLQQTVFERYPDTSDSFVRGESSHRPLDFDERGYGSCYDRAMLLEQTLRHYGFDVRRVAVYEHQSFPLNYLRPGINSHALSEVKTERGWMVLESIDPLIGIDDNDRVYSIGDIRDGMENGTIDDTTFGTELPDNFFDGQFIYVYGLHSRHGYFFEPHLPVPEVDWTHFAMSF